MDGYTVWKLHRAIKLHLLTKKYDLFEHNGATKHSSLENYLVCNEFKMFEAIGMHFTKPNDAVQFFVSNIVYTGKDAVYEMAAAWANYKLWIKHKESLTKLIQDDLELLRLPDDLFNDNPPKLLRGIIGGKILPETAIAINRVIPFAKAWTEKHYLGSGNWPLIIHKADRLIGRYNTEIINQLIHHHETV